MIDRWRLAGAALAVVSVGLVAGCSGGGSSSSAPATTFAAVVDGAEVEAAVTSVVEVSGVTGAAGRCVELQLASDPELAGAAASGGGGGRGLPPEVVAVVRACRLTAGFVDEFVAGVASASPLDDAQRACVSDVYLGLSVEEREALTAAAFAPVNQGAAEVAAGLDDRIAGCGVELEADG